MLRLGLSLALGAHRRVPAVGAAVTDFPRLAQASFDWMPDDLTGTLADGASISTVADRINGATGTAAAGFRPTFKAGLYNGKGAARFGGTAAPASISFGRPSALTAAMDGSTRTMVAVVANRGSNTTYGALLAAYSGGGTIYLADCGTRMGSSTFSSSAATQTSFPVPGTGLRVVVMVVGNAAFGNSDGVFIDGTRVGIPYTGTSGTKNFSIGGSDNNTASIAAHCDILRVTVLPVCLTPAEVTQVVKNACDTFGTQGVYPWTGKPYYIFDANSQWEGQGATAADYVPPSLAAASMALPLGTWTNLSKGGISMSSMITKATTNLDPIVPMVTGAGGASKVVVSYGEWYNQAAVAPGPFNSAKAYGQARKAANPSIKLALWDAIDTGAPSGGLTIAAWRAAKLDYVNAIAGGYTSFADAVINVASDANIGVDGSANTANAYWQSDLVHEVMSAATPNGGTAFAAKIVAAISGL